MLSINITYFIYYFQERLSRLLECKVSMLKLTVSVRRALGEVESDDSGLAVDLAALLAAWEDAHQRCVGK